MTTDKVNILMTGGAPGAAGILKCLQENKSFHITVADVNPAAVDRYLNKDFEIIPLAGDPRFVHAILSLCRKRNIQVVLPLVTKELVPLSKYQKEFELAGVKLLVSPVPSLEIANNKSRLYEFLQWRGVKVPDFRVVETTEQFKKAVDELGYPEKTVCFKPSESNGSPGFRVISRDMDETHFLLHEKDNSTFITWNDAVKILAAKPFPEFLVSEYLPGEEYSVDCLAKHGEPVLIVPQLRKKMINSISVEGEFVKEETIISYCQQIIKELQLHGNIGIQVKCSAAGQFLVLEISPRVQGSIAAVLSAGINLPVLAVKQELGLPISPKESEVKWGTKFSRYRDDVFY